MNDNDLISRAAAIEYLMTNMGWRDEDGYEVDDADEKRAIITDLVDGIPAVDAAPVVRCRNCKHRIVNENAGKKGYLALEAMCALDTNDPYELGRNAEDPDWFCADGERRDDDALSGR